MKPIIVSVGTQPRFQLGLKRLEQSIQKKWDGDSVLFTDYPQPPGFTSYTQEEMPYQFKVSAIEQALHWGYKKIIWLDSIMQVNRNPIELLDNSNGIVFFHNVGHDLSQYITDEALALLGVSEVSHIPQIWGGAFMLDFNKENVVEFWDEVKKFSLNGSFKNGTSKNKHFVAHRHDQAVISVLAYNKCTMLPYGYILWDKHFKSEYDTVEGGHYITYQGI